MTKRLRHGEYVGNRETPEHYIWRAMLRRKNNRGGHYYENIQVCPHWLVFENFLADMGRRPSSAYSIERTNNKGHYGPGNCKWATRSEQQKNKRTTRRWLQGSTVGTLVEWAQILGMSKALAHWRMKNWNTFEKGKLWVLLSHE